MSQMISNYDEALRNFKAMFPGTSEDIIAEVVRMHNGDVNKIVNELLSFPSNPTSSRASSSTAMNSDYFYLEPPPPYSEVVKKQEVAQPALSCTDPPAKSTPSSSTTSKPVKDETIDDEKIALMIQNEEFLSYLRTDPAFMREIYGTNSSRSAPRNNATSRPYSGNTLRYSRDTYTPLTPNGPIVEVAASSIPNGPLVDYNYNDSTIWSKRIKSKLPGRKPTDFSYTDSCNSTAIEPYYSPSDFSSKLRAMSRTSKLMFLTLARKFSMRPSMKLLPDYETSSDRSPRKAFK